MGSLGRQPLIFPYMYHLTISHPPSCTHFNDLQAVVDTLPSIRMVASKLCSYDITIREVLGFVYSCDQ